MRYFADEVREELARAPKKRRCCALAEIAAMVLSSGGLTFRGMGKYGISVHTENASVAGRYMKMFERFLGAKSTLRSAVSQKLGEHTRYEALPPDEDVAGMTHALQLLDPEAPFGMRTTVPEKMLVNPCCKSAFLRGAFLGCGTIGDPEKAYQLEFAFGDEALTDQTSELLETLSIPHKKTLRKTQFLIYLKDGEGIGDLLSHMAAYKAVTDLLSIRVMKEMRMQINRQVNCDTSNVDKVIDAAEQQIAAIRFIDKCVGIASLEPRLRMLAEIREKYPDRSLSDLGALLEPPLSKSGVNARMRKLKLIAEELAND